jgi:hypothetical protein
VNGSGKEILNSLTSKLKTALDEVNQIKDTLLATAEAERIKESVKGTAKVVEGEAERVFEKLGRETYELVKTGKVAIPDAIRETFEWAEKSLARFAEPEAAPAAEGEPVAEPVAEPEQPAAPHLHVVEAVVEPEEPAAEEPPAEGEPEQQG